MNKFWKNKKVTAFVALKHHTRFIIPIMKELTLLGAKTNYLVALAERSQEITAIETNIPFQNAADFIIEDDDNEKVFKIYQNLRNTFASSLLKDKAFSLQVPTVLDKTLFSTAQEYIGFQNYFKKNKPDICLALHETNRWGKLFSFHSKKAGVPFITLQEGLYTSVSSDSDYIYTGHVQNSTFCFVWGESTRKKLCGFEAPEDRIIPSGNTHLANEIQNLKKNKMRIKKRKEYKISNKFIVVLFFSAQLPKIVSEFFNLFDAPKKMKSIKLFVKFHPATPKTNIDSWISKFPEKTKKNVDFIHGQENTYYLMEMSDLCVLAEASTTGLEAIAIGIPLVLLKLQSEVVCDDTTLIDKNAAIQFTPDELTNALLKKHDFKKMVNNQGVKKYLNDELHENENSIKCIVDYMEKIIHANKDSYSKPIKSKIKTNIEWSIVLPVIKNPEIFIATLENLALHSKDEDYEVILICDNNPSDEIRKILQSLEGDIVILEQKQDQNLSETMNIAGVNAKGKTLLFLDHNLLCTENWLLSLKKGINEFGTKKIFGGQVVNAFNNIVHAGMIVDANNSPNSAYLHLDDKFPAACKTRSFQMVNNFIGVDKKLFLNNSGFHHKAGRYKFMDFCLRASKLLLDPDAIIYLHNLKFIQISPFLRQENFDSAIYFYSKWHGQLWDTEETFLKKDNISNLQIDGARMTRAMETALKIKKN